VCGGRRAARRHVPWAAVDRWGANPAVALRDYTATIRTNLGEIALTSSPDAAPNACGCSQAGGPRATTRQVPLRVQGQDGGRGRTRRKAKGERARRFPTRNPSAAASGRRADGQDADGRTAQAASSSSWRPELLDRSYTAFAEYRRPGRCEAHRKRAVGQRWLAGAGGGRGDRARVVTKKAAPSQRRAKEINAVLDGRSGACNPESATPGSNSLPRRLSRRHGAVSGVEAGSHAMGGVNQVQVERKQP